MYNYTNGSIFTLLMIEMRLHESRGKFQQFIKSDILYNLLLAELNQTTDLMS